MVTAKTYGAMSHTFIARGRVWPDNRLLHLRALVLRDQSASDIETADIVWVLESEAKLLGVVVDVLHAVQCEADEALVYPIVSIYPRISRQPRNPLTSSAEDLLRRPAADCRRLCLRSISKLFGRGRGVLLPGKGIVATTNGSRADSAV